MTASAKPSYPREQQIILLMYVLFFGSLTFSMITPPALAVLSLMVCILILSGIYSVRIKSAKYSLLENHATFLIRTFWRANLYLVYAMIPGLLYMIILTDYSPLYPCTNYVSTHWLRVMERWNVEDYQKFFQQCTTPFIKNNLFSVVIGLFIMIFPVLIYLLNRLILGWSHAIKNLPVAESKL